jgi:hypothetical protein
MARANSSAVSGVYAEGLSTMLLPMASAGAIFQTAIISGKFQGTMPAQTPIGSRCTKFHDTKGVSTQGSGSYQGICSACSARWRKCSMASGTSTTEVLRRMAPACCDSSIAQWPEVSAMCLAMANMISVRCCCVLKRHSPLSKERRAAAIARSTSSFEPEGTWAITSSLEGLMTSYVSPPAAATHSPSMYC